MADIIHTVTNIPAFYVSPAMPVGQVGASLTPEQAIAQHNATMADDVQTIQLRAVSKLQQDYLGLPDVGILSNLDGNDSKNILDPLTSLPFNHIPLDTMGTLTLPGIGVESVVLTYQVQFGYEAIIKLYSINYLANGFTDGSGDIIWRIKIDGRAVKNFDNITTQRGSLATPRQIYDLRVFSGQVLTLTVVHVANAALNGDVEGSFIGITYPSKGN